MLKLPVAIVDGKRLFTESLAEALSLDPEIEVWGCCTSESLSAKEEWIRNRIRVILWILDSPNEHTPPLAAELRREGFQGKVVLIVPELHPSLDRIASGAAVLLKHGSLAALLEVIHSTRQPTDSAVHPAAPHTGETDQRVLECLLQGLANKEIATRIGTTEAAVKRTFQRLFKRFGVRSRSEVVRVVLERRTMPPQLRGSKDPLSAIFFPHKLSTTEGKSGYSRRDATI